MTSVACVVIAGGERGELLSDLVIPSCLAQQFDDVLVVGEHHAGDGYNYLHVPALTKSTVDALVKRDVGTLATTCDVIAYLCDDHAWIEGKDWKPVGNIIRECSTSHMPWDVLIPQRYAEHPEKGLVRINNGESQGYCGGHAGVYRRRVIQDRPWSAMPHHRLWDVYASQLQQKAGFQYVANAPIAVLDLEPEREPWK